MKSKTWLEYKMLFLQECGWKQGQVDVFIMSINNTFLDTSQPIIYKLCAAENLTKWVLAHHWPWIMWFNFLYYYIHQNIIFLCCVPWSFLGMRSLTSAFFVPKEPQAAHGKLKVVCTGTMLLFHVASLNIFKWKVTFCLTTLP